MRFVATVRDGRAEMAPLTKQRFVEWCQANEGRRIVIEDVKSARSISQLRMYRAWLQSVAAHTGNDEDELHEFLIDQCAPTVVISVKGPKGTVEVERKKRTSGGHSLTMNKAEMTEYMDKCAALTGYPLPTEEELIAMGYAPNKGSEPGRVKHDSNYQGKPTI